MIAVTASFNQIGQYILMSITTAQAVTLLENVLFESATIAQANAAQWVELSQIDPSHADVAGVAQAIASTEEAGTAEQVARYYEGALGRMPSSSEIAYYVGIAENGLSASQIALGTIGVPQAAWNQIAGYFAASPEFGQLYSGSQSSVIASLYQNILDRAPSAAETAYYQKLLDGGTSVSTLVQYFVTSPEYQANENPQIATVLAANGVTVVTDPITVIPITGLLGSVSFSDGFSGAGFSMSSGAGATTTSATIGGEVGAWTGTLTIAPATISSLTVTGSGTNTIDLPAFPSAELLTFATVSGSGADLVYTSAGTVHTIAVTTGSSVELPAGATAIELTGIQSGLHVTFAAG